MHAPISTRCCVLWKKPDFRNRRGQNQASIEHKVRGRKMLSQELQTALDAAFMVARRQHHEMLTVEHLLMSLLDRQW